MSSITWSTKALIDVSDAYSFMRKNSSLTKEAGTWERLERNYDGAIRKCSSVKDETGYKNALYELIKGVFSNNLYFQLEGDSTIWPFQKSDDKAKKVEVILEADKASLNIPHFFASDDWEALFKQVDTIKEKKHLVIDLSNNHGQGEIFNRFAESVFGEWWNFASYKAYENVRWLQVNTEANREDIRQFLENKNEKSLLIDPYYEELLKEMGRWSDDSLVFLDKTKITPPTKDVACPFESIHLITAKENQANAFTLYYTLRRCDQVFVFGEAPEKRTAFADRVSKNLPSGTRLNVPSQLVFYPKDN